MRTKIGGLALTVAALVLCAQFAAAHKVNLFGYAEGGFVHVEGYFTDGVPSANSGVEVYGPGGGLIAQGATDGDGRFFFPAEVPGSYRVTMNASMGHVTEIDVEVGEKSSTGVAAGGADKNISGGALPAAPVGATELSALTEKVENLAEEVRALRRRLEKPGFSQIVGGLGFIVGLAGAYLWGASRKKG